MVTESSSPSDLQAPSTMRRSFHCSCRLWKTQSRYRCRRSNAHPRPIGRPGQSGILREQANENENKIAIQLLLAREVRRGFTVYLRGVGDSMRWLWRQSSSDIRPQNCTRVREVRFEPL